MRDASRRHRSGLGMACPSLIALMGVVAFDGLAAAGPTFDETIDAGSTPGTAQPVAGPTGTPVTQIRGVLTGTADSVDFEDVYVICITDPAAFRATVSAADTTFDTQLWLFTLPGFGLLSNDNDPFNFPTIYSHLQQPATDATAQTIPGPGLYLLAISSKANRPVGAGGAIFFDASANGTEISGPDGPGGGSPLANWSQSPGATDGAYTIDLKGVEFCGLPCDTPCPAEATVDADRGSCTSDGTDPNAGCTLFGAPMQALGMLGLASYRAVCGTTGTVPPNHRDEDWFTFTLAAPTYVTASLAARTPMGAPVPHIVLEVNQGATCGTLVPVFSSVNGPCPVNSGPLPLPAGVHSVRVSVSTLAPAGPPCPTEYLLWLGAEAPAFAPCGSLASGNCGTAHADPGCAQLACCDAVCALEAICCELAWDARCADLALALCLDVPYVCDPAILGNDCVRDAQDLPANATISVDTTLATTDGAVSPAAPCLPGKDVWYRVRAPEDGTLLVSTCSSSEFNVALALYRLPASGEIDPIRVFDGRRLLACNDDGCGTSAGPAIVETTVKKDDYVLIRAGGIITAGVAASGVLQLETSFAEEVFTTGATFPVLFDAANTANFSVQTVGLSSGAISVAAPQRWMAQAFTVGEGTGGAGYAITTIHGYGASADAATNETLHYIVWSREGQKKPLDGDQIATGSVPFPVPFDNPFGPAALEAHRLVIEPPIALAPGEYWLTLYAGNAAPPGTPANFLWFLSAPTGINLLDANDAPFTWRSQAFPVPGFVVSTLAPGVLKQAPTAHPSDLYNAGFRIGGVPLRAGCNADVNGDGFVGGDDLAILLGSWSGRGAADLDGDGVVGGADLAILLGAWGRCP